MKFTNSMKIDGELAARDLSDKARKYYNGTDPLTLYKYTNENDEPRYAVKDDCGIRDNLDFEQVDEWFCQMQEEIDRMTEDDDD